MSFTNSENAGFSLYDIEPCISEACIRVDQVSEDRTLICTLLGALEARVNRERLLELEISFVFRGEEYYFQVRRVRSGYPYDLELEPVNRADLKVFKSSLRHVAMVGEIVFLKNGTELFRKRNSFFRPETLT